MIINSIISIIIKLEKQMFVIYFGNNHRNIISIITIALLNIIIIKIRINNYYNYFYINMFLLLTE